jgi:hypothetical protein
MALRQVLTNALLETTPCVCGHQQRALCRGSATVRPPLASKQRVGEVSYPAPVGAGISTHPASHGMVLDDAGGRRGGGGALTDGVLAHRAGQATGGLTGRPAERCGSCRSHHSHDE